MKRWEKRRTQSEVEEVMGSMKRAADLIREELSAWPGVEAVPHRFGGTEYRYGRKELGHVHGDRLADLPLPRKLHDEVIASGRAEPHHVLPESGWVTCRMSGSEDVAGVIELFRMQYERYVARTAAATGQAGGDRQAPDSGSQSPADTSPLKIGSRSAATADRPSSRSAATPTSPAIRR